MRTPARRWRLAFASDATGGRACLATDGARDSRCLVIAARWSTTGTGSTLRVSALSGYVVLYMDCTHTQRLVQAQNRLQSPF